MLNKKNQTKYLKLFFILIGFLVLMLSSLSMISAANICTIESSSANCQGIAGGKVVMKLSSSDNSHGALASDASYSNVLCCNFGSGSTVCNQASPVIPSNEILSLSSTTNAHAERPENSFYTNKVCYENLINCFSGTSAGVGEIEVIKLSGITNAHLGTSYNTKIICTVNLPPPTVCGNNVVESPPEQCDDGNTASGDGCSSTCQLEPDVYWANDAAGTQPINSRDIEIGDTIYAIGKNFDGYIGQILTLNTYEEDPLSNDGEIISTNAPLDSNGDFSFAWTITQANWDIGYGIFDDGETTATAPQEHIFDVLDQNDQFIIRSPVVTLTLTVPGTPQAYWSDSPGGSQISSITKGFEDDVYMTGGGLNQYEDQEVSLLIQKVNLALNTDIKTITTTVSQGDISEPWTINSIDLANAGIDCTNGCQFTVLFKIRQSGSTIISSNELDLTITGINECINTNACADYPQSQCNMGDACNVAPNGPLPPNTDCDDPNTDCGCIWNTIAGTCDVKVVITDTNTYCGDNVTQRPNDAGMPEDCDPNNGTAIFWFSGNEDSCVDLSTNLNPPIDTYNGGSLNCIACAYDTSSCTSTAEPFCGNNAIDQLSEACDTNQFAGRSCETEGYSGGTLGCYSNISATPCQLNFGACTLPPSIYATCVGQSCNIVEGVGTTQCAIDSNCIGQPEEHSECINNMCTIVAGSGEYECGPIGDDCNIPSESHAICVGQSCVIAVGVGTNECVDSTGCVGEPLAHTECNNEMCEVVAGAGEDECAPVGGSCDVQIGGYCGDGIIQQPNSAGKDEYCDGTNMTKTLCTQLNSAIYQSGSLSCNGCTYDVSACVFKPGIVPVCGDNVLNQLNESCDNGFYYQGHTCKSMGYDGGSLSCTSQCKIDNSGCVAPPPGSEGSCQITQNTTDTCADGFLSFTWTGQWIGQERIEPQATDCEMGGSDVIPCPALVQLPFFSTGNVIAIIILAILIYLIISRKKKPSKQNSKRRR